MEGARAISADHARILGGKTEKVKRRPLKLGIRPGREFAGVHQVVEVRAVGKLEGGIKPENANI